MIRRPPRSTQSRSSAASDVYKRQSEHPLAAAIVAGALERGLELDDVAEFDSFTGKGVGARLHGRNILIGNERLLVEAGVDVEDLLEHQQRLAVGGQSLLVLQEVLH